MVVIEVILRDIILVVIHIIGAIVGLFLGWSAMRWTGWMKKLAPFFGFYALAEMVYILSYLGLVEFNLSRLIGEALLLIGALVAAFAIRKMKAV